VTPPLPLDQVEHLVRATTLGHLVRIDARAPQSSQALQLANAVANGYVQASAEYGLGAAVVLSTSALVPNAQSGKSLMLHGLIGLMVGLLVGAAVVLVMGRRWLWATTSTIGD
jgi:capsular polysaccharide biosynthesis protein